MHGQDVSCDPLLQALAAGEDGPFPRDAERVQAVHKELAPERGVSDQEPLELLPVAA